MSADQRMVTESHTTSNEEIDKVEPSNSIGAGVAGQSEVDIRVVESETMIKTFVSSGSEILKVPAEVTKVREACEFLTSPQLIGVIPMQRKAAIYFLKSALDNLISRFYRATTFIDKDNELNSSQVQYQSVATEKLKEAEETLCTLERKLAEFKTTISTGDNKLQTLYLRFKELIALHKLNLLSIHLQKAEEDRRHVEEQWKSIQSLFRAGE